jgi:hypothetical protein
VEVESGNHNALGRQRSIDTGIVVQVAVVPSAAVHIDDGRKRPCAFGSVNPRHPGFAILALILDIMLIYVVFVMAVHGANLQPPETNPQVQQPPLQARVLSLPILAKPQAYSPA